MKTFKEILEEKTNTLTISTPIANKKCQDQVTKVLSDIGAKVSSSSPTKTQNELIWSVTSDANIVKKIKNTKWLDDINVKY